LLAHDEWRGEVQQIDKTGRRIMASARATLVRDRGGQPASVLIINTDITEQKELETRFLRAQRLESIGTLASGVAHDLNNILSPILMSAPLLRRSLPAEARNEIVDTIETSASRGAQIIKQVLTLGRGVEGERKPMQLASVVKEIIKMLSETFPKEIFIDSAFPHDLWPVIGDATQLHQVLLNLCVNARDAMPRGGALCLSGRNLELDESYASMLPGVVPGPHVVLEVSAGANV
jgi:signal transduction histidine kinase